jgi:uncharacterized RDD family membrane protein YckC
MSDFYTNLTIDTPENVELDAEVAGFGTRCIAAILDYLILGIVILIITLLFFQAMFSPLRQSQNTTMIALWVGIQFVIVTFYHLIFEFLWNGQTPGKRWLNIRVVQANGLPATTTGLLIRNLVRVFDFFPVFYGIGLAVMFATKNTQRLGDLAAKTVVIRERRALSLHTIRENYAVMYHHINRNEPLPDYVRLDGLTEQDRMDIVNYLQRRKELSKREYVVGILASRIARQTGNENLVQEFKSPYAAEHFLEQVARAFELAAVQQVNSPS